MMTNAPVETVVAGTDGQVLTVKYKQGDKVDEKKIIVPAGQKEEDLELLVEAEANQYIPFALDEVNLDFQTLGPAPNNPDESEVLIAASRKEKVEDRVARGSKECA